MSHNSNIIYWFELLIKQLQFYADKTKKKDKLINLYRLDSIKKALNAIKQFPKQITNGAELKDIPSVGKGTIRRIDEILETGKLAEVNNADISGYLLYIEELENIFGIGKKLAHELYTKHGIKSIQELKTAYEEKKLTLPKTVVKGLKYADKIKLGIRRKEVDKIARYLCFVCLEIDPELGARICGSYRREKETMNDIDVVLSHPKLKTLDDTTTSELMKNFIKKLFEEKFMVDSLTSIDVPTKYMGICNYINPRSKKIYPMRRIDIRFMPQESYYTAILYFTGSKDYNRKMRAVAQDMGYTLNEYCLMDNSGKTFEITSEEQIFELLGMEYVMPKLRNA